MITKGNVRGEAHSRGNVGIPSRGTHLCDATIQVFGTPSGRLGREIGPQSCWTFSGIVHVSNWLACSVRMHGPRRGGSTVAVNATLRCPSPWAGSAAAAGGDLSLKLCSSGCSDTVCESRRPLSDVVSTTYSSHHHQFHHHHRRYHHHYHHHQQQLSSSITEGRRARAFHFNLFSAALLHFPLSTAEYSPVVLVIEVGDNP